MKLLDRATDNLTAAPSTWQIWLAAVGLWLLCSGILIVVTVGALSSALVWFFWTPIRALLAATRGVTK